MVVIASSRKIWDKGGRSFLRGKHPCGHSRRQYGSSLSSGCAFSVHRRTQRGKPSWKRCDIRSSTGRTIENVGIGNGMGNRCGILGEVREERSSRALPREESTRRFVRWLVSPRLATTSDLYPYMLSGVIDYRERSISKVQRSSCDSPPRLPSAFVTPDPDGVRATASLAWPNSPLSSFMSCYLRVNRVS